MKTSLTVPGNRNYLFGGDVIVPYGDTLSIGPNSGLVLNQDLYIEGGFSLGSNSKVSGTQYTGIHLNDRVGPVQLDHIWFHGAKLWNYSHNLVVSNCIFDSVFSSDDNKYGLISNSPHSITVSQTNFSNSSLFLKNPDFDYPNSLAYVHHCSFNPGGIAVEGYKKFRLEHNIIQNYDDYGISLFYAGNGSSHDQSVLQNNIHNCLHGIFLNSSNATISGNTITNNERGVYAGNRSHLSLSGTTLLAQTIRDCDREEVYAETGCFPLPFQYNKIIDEDNDSVQYPGDTIHYPLVRYANYSAASDTVDVRNNCWGNNFSPKTDLVAANAIFIVDPIWCPGNPGPWEPPIDMYKTAIIQYDSGNYINARSIFKEIVHYYPASIEAQSSLKELFSIERYAGNDYSGLQQYYLTNDSIIADSVLSPIAKYFAKRCDEMIANWDDEIAWCEDRIVNPESATDSIFAILDLAYVYSLMENSPTKSTHTGTLTGFGLKPLKSYLPFRDSLISLLPVTQKTTRLLKKVLSLSAGELLQNVPNPAHTSTQLYYRLAYPGPVIITIYDMFNKVVFTRFITDSKTGINTLAVDLSNLPAGIYLCSLTINNSVSDVKKLCVY